MKKHQQNILMEKVCKEDCHSSFATLYDHLYPKLFKVAKFFTQTNFAAEEVLAEVFIQFWQNRKKNTRVENVQGYFFIAVKRQSLRYLQKNKAYQSFDFENLKNLMIEVSNPESSLLDNELKQAFLSAVKNLPPKCRMVFRLVKDDGLKYKEVAEILNISDKTVEMHMSNALKSIRHDMQPFISSQVKTSRKINSLSILILLLLFS